MAFASLGAIDPTRITRPPITGRWIWCFILLAALLLTGCRSSTTTRNMSGVRNFQVGQYQNALQDFQRALFHDPDNPNAYYNLAATYYELGKRNGDASLLQQAEGHYHQCLDLSPNHVECHRGLAALLVDTGRPDSAFTLLNRWVMRSPQLPDARIEAARLYEEFGDNKTATRYLTDALHLDTKNVRAWTALGRIREQDGQLAQALSNYQQAYQINQFQPGVVERIAALQRHLSTSAGTQLASPEAPQSR